MATSNVNYIYDADTAFRAPGQAPVTATGSVGVVPLDKMDKVRPSDQRNQLGAEAYTIVIAVEEIDAVDGDETYVFDVIVEGAGGANPVTAASFPVVAEGKAAITLDADTLEKLSADREQLNLTLNAGGTTPSIKFAAWVAPARGA